MKVIQFAVAACILALLSSAFSAAAQYPTKPVRIVVPFPPGGGGDMIGRILAEKLGERWGGAQVIVENRPGADTQIGTQLVANAAPDGYTLLMVTSTFAVNYGLYPKLPYDSMGDFTPIAPLVESSLFLVVNPTMPVNSVHELIALAKKEPGKLTWSSGSGITFLAGEMFKSMAGIEVLNVPYKGSAPQVLAVMSGEASYTFDTYLLTKQHIEAGKLRLLAVTSRQRSAEAPSTPTVEETGLKGYYSPVWWGLVGPARMDPALVSRLNSDIKAVMSMPELKTRFEKLATRPFYDTPEGFGSFLRSELNKFQAVVKSNNLKRPQ